MLESAVKACQILSNGHDNCSAQLVHIDLLVFLEWASWVVAIVQEEMLVDSVVQRRLLELK